METSDARKRVAELAAGSGEAWTPPDRVRIEIHDVAGELAGALMVDRPAPDPAETCEHRVIAGRWCAGCDMYDQPATPTPAPAPPATTGPADEAEAWFDSGDIGFPKPVAEEIRHCYTDEELAARDAAQQRIGAEALDACREQRADLLELIEAEREQHAEALRRVWHEGYGAGSSDATDGWLHPGSPSTSCPYPAPVQPPAPDPDETCAHCRKQVTGPWLLSAEWRESQYCATCLNGIEGETTDLDARCGWCGEPESNCPNDQNECCCLPCFERKAEL